MRRIDHVLENWSYSGFLVLFLVLQAGFDRQWYIKDVTSSEAYWPSLSGLQSSHPESRMRGSPVLLAALVGSAHAATLHRRAQCASTLSLATVREADSL